MSIWMYLEELGLNPEERLDSISKGKIGEFGIALIELERTLDEYGSSGKATTVGDHIGLDRTLAEYLGKLRNALIEGLRESDLKPDLVRNIIRDLRGAKYGRDYIRLIQQYPVLNT